MNNTIFCSSSLARTQEEYRNLNRMDQAAKITAIALVIIAVAALSYCTAGLAGFAIFAVGAGSASFSAVAFATHKFIERKLLCFVENDPNLPPPEEISPYVQAANIPSVVDSFPTSHCAETDLWRKRLISEAQHNVIISGNYCGGKAFDEILDLLNQKLVSNPEFTVVIITSPIFVKNNFKDGYQNIKKIQKLKQEFSERFSVVESGNFWHYDESLKYITNHTKATVIDYGKYYVLGGSAIKDNFNKEGVDDPRLILLPQYPYAKKPVIKELENFLIRLRGFYQANKNILSEEMNKEIQSLLFSLKIDPTMSAKKIEELYIRIKNLIDKLEEEKYQNQLFQCADILEDNNNSSPELTGRIIEKITEVAEIASNLLKLLSKSRVKKTVSFLDSFLPGNFRDMDFVFKDDDHPHSQGKLLYLNLLLLASRWDHLNNNFSPNISMQKPYPFQTICQMPAFTKASIESSMLKVDGLNRLLLTPIPKFVDTHVVEFENHAFISKKGKVKIFYSGPENEKSVFHEEILSKIQEAKKEIVINHMYFNPSNNLYNALSEAVQRGVKITIVTNEKYPDCPKSHLLFGPNNTYMLHKFFNDNSNRTENINVYMYKQKKKTDHKKVIIIDNTHVLAGSSNLGYKSLETTADHEINFSLESPENAKHTLEITRQDINNSVRKDPSKPVSVGHIIRAFLYRQFAIIWG